MIETNDLRHDFLILFLSNGVHPSTAQTMADDAVDLVTRWDALEPVNDN